MKALPTQETGTAPGLPLLLLAGPTASGKSAVAVALARRLEGEVISADSRQVYRYMDIGTATPILAERDGVPHHGFDLVAPDERYTAGAFAADARRWIGEILRRGHRPLLAGGSGLYLQAAVDGFSPGSEKYDLEARERLRERARREGLELLHRELAEKDPAYAAQVGPGDRARILRALEYITATGSLFSRLHARPREGLDLPVRWFGLRWPREELDRRIEARVDAMLDRGLVQEVRALLDRGYGGREALRSVGYGEVVAWLEGRIGSPKQMRDKIVANTRRFARRQRTWFRREKRIHWVEAPGRSPDQLAEEIAALAWASMK